MDFVDTHCHLTSQPLAGSLAEVLSRAYEAQVTRIVVPSYDLASWDDVRDLKNSGSIFKAFGLHPWVADQELDISSLKTALKQTRAVAVGEIGLDSKIELPKIDIQKKTLLPQLEAAQSLNLPVLLHCRGAFEELIEMLSGFKPRIRGVLHAYSRGPELMERFLDLGLHIAFGGAITRPGARRARQSAATVPMDKMLLETDAPSIGLQGVEPEKVEPRHVAVIARSIAEIRSMPIEEIAQATTENATELFGLTVNRAPICR